MEYLREVKSAFKEELENVRSEQSEINQSSYFCESGDESVFTHDTDASDVRMWLQLETTGDNI